MLLFVLNALTNRASIWAWVPAVASGTYNYHAFKGFLAPLGLGQSEAVLAFVAATAVTVVYWLISVWLLTGVARLAPKERRPLYPIITIAMVLIALASAGPNILMAGSATAYQMEDRAYIAQIARIGDHTKSVGGRVLQLAGTIDGYASTFDQLEKLERKGRLTGFSSPNGGPTSDWIASKAVVFRSQAAALRKNADAISAAVVAVDRTTSEMRKTLSDYSVSMAERRNRVQAQADGLRTQIVGLAGMLPIASLSGLADRLQGSQVTPIVSSKANVRAGQKRGIATVVSELKATGVDLAKRVNRLQTDLQGDVPIYDPPPATVLVLKHADGLITVFAFALGLDFLIFVIFGLACGIGDAARSRGDDRADLGSDISYAHVLRVKELMARDEPRYRDGGAAEARPLPSNASTSVPGDLQSSPIDVGGYSGRSRFNRMKLNGEADD
ncbi:MAG: hypothetical protein AAF709_09680 [Pseudomonadota bacterium]